MIDTQFAMALWTKHLDLIENINLKHINLGSHIGFAEGHLSYSSTDGLILKNKLGLIELENLQDRYSESLPFSGRNKLFGIDIDGNYYLLCGINEIRLEKNGPGFIGQTFKVSIAFKGKHLIKVIPSVEWIEASITGLAEWVGQSALNKAIAETQTSEKDDNQHNYDMTSVFNKPMEYILYEDDRMQISVINSIESHYLIPHELSVRDSYVLRVRYKNKSVPLKVAYSTDLLEAYHFLSICMGYQGSINEIRLKSSEQDEPIQFFIHNIGGIIKPSILQESLKPLPYYTIKDKTQEMYGRWLQEDEAIRVAGRSIPSAPYEDSSDPSNDFLTVSKAVEALCGTPPEKDTIEPNQMSLLKEVIGDSNLDSETKKRACQVLDFSNKNVSFRDKMSFLYDELIPFSSHLIPNKDEFLKQHINSRNALTHLKHHGGPPLQGLELIEHTRIIIILGYCALLRRLGFSVQNLNDIFGGTMMYVLALGGSSHLYGASIIQNLPFIN